MVDISMDCIRSQLHIDQSKVCDSGGCISISKVCTRCYFFSISELQLCMSGGIRTDAIMEMSIFIPCMMTSTWTVCL